MLHLLSDLEEGGREGEEGRELEKDYRLREREKGGERGREMVKGINKIMIVLFARNEWNMIHHVLLLKYFNQIHVWSQS